MSHAFLLFPKASPDRSLQRPMMDRVARASYAQCILVRVTKQPFYRAKPRTATSSWPPESPANLLPQFRVLRNWPKVPLQWLGRPHGRRTLFSGGEDDFLGLHLASCRGGPACQVLRS